MHIPEPSELIHSVLTAEIQAPKEKDPGQVFYGRLGKYVHQGALSKQADSLWGTQYFFGRKQELGEKQQESEEEGSLLRPHLFLPFTYYVPMNPRVEI